MTQQLKFAIKNWVQYVDKTKSSSFVVTYLQQLFDQDKNQKFLWLVEKMYQIKSDPHVDILHDRDYVAASCIHPYLRSLLFKDQHIAQVIFEGITMFLGHPDTTRSCILPLLHVFKQFIEIRPGDNIVLSASYVLLQRKYFLWPKPYSSLALDILKLLTLEKKAPGNALRQRFYQENPTIVDKPSNKLANRVYFFVDSKCKDAEEVGKLMEYLVPPAMSKAETQLTLLANIIYVELEIESDLLGLEYLTPEEAACYFQEAIQILKEAVMMKQDDALNYKRRQLNSLKDKILLNCNNSSVQIPLSSKNTTPRLPPVDIVMKVISCDTEQPNLSDVLDSGTLLPERVLEQHLLEIFQENSDCEPTLGKKTQIRIGICGNDMTLHHVTGALAHLDRTNQKFQNFDTKIYFIPIENGLFGDWLGRQDPWYGRNVLCITKAFCHTFPSIIEFKSTPTKKKLLSKKSSQSIMNLDEDTTEGRRRSLSSDSVMAEMQRMLLLSRAGGTELRPAVSSRFTQRRSKKSLFFNPYSPRHVFRHELENYFREAKTPMLVKVYCCECWFSDSIQSDLVVPFLLYAELGSEVEGGVCESPYTSSRLRSLATSLQLRYCLVDFEGSKEQWIDSPYKSYSKLSLCNVPKDKEFSWDASPCQQSLIMVTTEFDKKKRLVNSSLQVTTAEIQTEKQKLHIVLDGQRYGPCFKFKITKLKNVKGTATKLSVMSFLPKRYDYE